VNLVKFLVDPPNLLLMDEPTTHLDIWAIEGLILALQKFEGTLVFISHDVHFIRSLATKVLHITERQGDDLHRRLRLLPAKDRRGGKCARGGDRGMTPESWRKAETLISWRRRCRMVRL
jgi:energy-coupling factor transporter ATP-binding protein EcfA2